MLLCLFRSNSDILSKSFRFVKYFFHLFDSVPGSFGWFPDCLYLSGSVVSAFPPQRLISYHFSFFLSTTFLIYFSQVVFQRIKGIKKYLRMLNGEGGIWTLAPRKRSTPLAGAPLQPLEYFSWISNSSDIVLTSLWRSFIIINSFWNVNWFFAFSLFIFSGLTCKVKFTFFNSPILLPCIQYVCILIWTQRNACRSHLTSDIKIWTIPSWI